MMIVIYGSSFPKGNGMNSAPTARVTDASIRIGAIYAERFAKGGHELVLIARNSQRMKAIAAKLRKGAGVAVGVIAADPADQAERFRGHA